MNQETLYLLGAIGLVWWLTSRNKTQPQNGFNTLPAADNPVKPTNGNGATNYGPGIVMPPEEISRDIDDRGIYGMTNLVGPTMEPNFPETAVLGGRATRGWERQTFAKNTPCVWNRIKFTT